MPNLVLTRYAPLARSLAHSLIASQTKNLSYLPSHKRKTAMRRYHRFLSTSASATCSRSEAGSILFLSPTLWPEPSSSAAGVRTTNLLQNFASTPSLFDSVHYGSGAPKPSTLTEYAHLHSLSTHHGIKLHDVPANKSDIMQDMLSDLPNLRAVLFDRYFAEEAYSFHFHRWKPNVLRILDMQDFHALRLSCTVRSGQNTIDDTGWGGLVGTEADTIARCAVRLYKDQSLWNEARNNARRLMRIKFNKEKNLVVVNNAIEEALLNRTERRSKDHISSLLWHQSMRATEYFSRWIELKEKK